jgi:Predicted acyltransferases
MNGIYDSLCVVFLFPFIVYLGASGVITHKYASKVNSFLGNISYPLYIVHYPFVYMYMAWIAKNKDYLKAGSTDAFMLMVLVAILTALSAIAFAYLSVKFYDIPVRKWLAKRFLSRK